MPFYFEYLKLTSYVLNNVLDYNSIAYANLEGGALFWLRNVLREKRANEFALLKSFMVLHGINFSFKHYSVLFS